MGSGMSKIVTGLYLGNIRDSEDHENLLRKGVTHILSVHNRAKPVLEDMTYLCISASDSSSENLLQHFKECIQFIHECRLGGGGCLVHCLAGVSRSTTILVAYLMTVTELGWQSCLAATKAVRSYASPNAGFQQQLQDYERTLLWEVKSPWIHFGGVCNQVQLLCMQLSVCPSWVLGMSLITWGFGGLHAKKKKENKFLRSASILCERTSKSSGKP
ncbi:dual specificity protein phosphatase 22-A-like isoform X5 [Corvus hawaiiensis]|uniref:dual specificity protein phosphatase 22-A-like isoform X5 n=1 Tax=Corvus hawaiiensis TaxID=134902 RepID=UPI002019C93F|nr:dual specificity protein phosphatase 22-A-like isoform X5 [Corvus hawaiiensis]